MDAKKIASLALVAIMIASASIAVMAPSSEASDADDDFYLEVLLPEDDYSTYWDGVSILGETNADKVEMYVNDNLEETLEVVDEMFDTYYEFPDWGTYEFKFVAYKGTETITQKVMVYCTLEPTQLDDNGKMLLIASCIAIVVVICAILVYALYKRRQ